MWVTAPLWRNVPGTDYGLPFLFVKRQFQLHHTLKTSKQLSTFQDKNSKHTHACMHAHTYTHTHIHAHTHTRAHTHTHTHTHTHAEERFFLFIFYGRETLLLLLRSKRCSSEPVLLNDASFPGSANIAQRLQKLREREGDRQRERERETDRQRGRARQV